MGLLTGLLTLPLAPVRGVAWVGEQIAEEADRELDVETRIRRELGELTTEEFERREDELLEQLEQVHATRREGAIADGE